MSKKITIEVTESQLADIMWGIDTLVRTGGYGWTTKWDGLTDHRRKKFLDKLNKIWEEKVESK